MSAPRTHRTYTNPPIEEALVEFRLVLAQGWDLTLPGKLHEKVKGEYAGKPREQRLVQASFQSVEGQPPGFAMHEGFGRAQLVDTEGHKLLSLGPDVLSVNVLKPYDGWQSFKPRIDQALRAYAEVAGADKVTRIGVRYINRVVIPSSDIDPSDYFLCGPAAPQVGLPSRLGAFVNRAEHVFDDGTKLIVTFASIDAEEGSSAYLLDLDVIWEGTAPLEISAALEKVDLLHQREGEAFEALITDKTREVFHGS